MAKKIPDFAQYTESWLPVNETTHYYKLMEELEKIVADENDEFSPTCKECLATLLEHMKDTSYFIHNRVPRPKKD